jgi:hypothetical protein
MEHKAIELGNTRTDTMVVPIPPKKKPDPARPGFSYAKLIRKTQASLRASARCGGPRGKIRANTLRVERLFGDVVPALKSS